MAEQPSDAGHDQPAQAAAERAADPDTLLDGEDPSSRHPDDIRHWLAAYSELISFKEALLRKGAEEMDTMRKPEALKEADSVDMTLLRAELDGYRRRHAFWQQRQAEVEGAGA